jgi:hypothetical protein
MAIDASNLLAADVKCYSCGHISGQIITRRGDGASRFIPRPGFSGILPSAGRRLRCERCNGPVFLEDAAVAALEKRASKEARPGDIARAA